MQKPKILNYDCFEKKIKIPVTPFSHSFNKSLDLEQA